MAGKQFEQKVDSRISRHPLGENFRHILTLAKILALSISDTNFLHFMQKFEMAAKVVGNDLWEKSPVDSDIRYLKSKILRD